jgi:hypothetical protein
VYIRCWQRIRAALFVSIKTGRQLESKLRPSLSPAAIKEQSRCSLWFCVAMAHAHRTEVCEPLMRATHVSTALDACQLNHLENERRCIIGILSLPPSTTTAPNCLLILYWAVIFQQSHACLINVGAENLSSVHLFSFPRVHNINCALCFYAL